MGTLTPVLTDNWDADRAWTLASYEDGGGYAALRRALTRIAPQATATMTNAISGRLWSWLTAEGPFWPRVHRTVGA